jgi:hypothetical protein
MKTIFLPFGLKPTMLFGVLLLIETRNAVKPREASVMAKNFFKYIKI